MKQQHKQEITPTTRSARRAFLQFLAASPVLASTGLTPRWFEELLVSPLQAQERDAVLIETVREALNVFDFRAVAKQALSPRAGHEVPARSFAHDQIFY